MPYIQLHANIRSDCLHWTKYLVLTSVCSMSLWHRVSIFPENFNTKYSHENKLDLSHLIKALPKLACEGWALDFDFCTLYNIDILGKYMKGYDSVVGSCVLWEWQLRREKAWITVKLGSLPLLPFMDVVRSGLAGQWFCCWFRGTHGDFNVDKEWWGWKAWAIHLHQTNVTVT